MSFGHGIRKLREARAQSLHELAEQAAIPWPTLSQIESNRYFPRLSELERLLTALNVRLEDVSRAAHHNRRNEPT